MPKPQSHQPSKAAQSVAIGAAEEPTSGITHALQMQDQYALQIQEAKHAEQ